MNIRIMDGAPPASQRDLSQGYQPLPLRLGAETYAAYRTVVSTAKLRADTVPSAIRDTLGQIAPQPG